MNLRTDITSFKKEFDPLFEDAIKKILHEQSEFYSLGDFDDEIGDALVRYGAGGKRVRPFIMKLISRRNFDDAKLVNAMLANEIFHLMALVHDDIIDASPLRRGVPTLHEVAQIFEKNSKTYGRDTALLIGDYLLVAALDYAQKTSDAIFQEFRTMMMRTVRGQQLDSMSVNLGLGNVTPEDVRTRHKLKTAWYTFVSPALIGWMLAGGDNANEKQELITIMLELGYLFQIRDDIIDCIDEKSGKSLFGDIMEGQTTWVTLFIKDEYPEYVAAIQSAKNVGDRDELKRIFEGIDLRDAYNGEYKKRKALIESIDPAYSDIQNVAEGLLGLLKL